jgi:glutamate dehydrogenase/leucine dehydrogenase
MISRDSDTGELRSSHACVDDLVEVIERHADGGRSHEAVFFEAGKETGALFATFVHRCERGQAQGGCRHWEYSTLESLLSDGLRLAVGMGRKSALAGVWWGGGKAVIARPAESDASEPEYRRSLFREFGHFISSLRGCYITAEDAGTTPLDIAEIYRGTRFVTCVPPELGGFGNPSPMTALGVIRGIEAGLDFVGSKLAGSRIAMQGGGNVGGEMIQGLLDRGAHRVVVSEISDERCSLLMDRFPDSAVCVRRSSPEDTSILAEPCDVLVPNALGGVLDSKTIPEIRARVVCGAANNPLQGGDRDATLLEELGITYVPDFIANRMGIVAVSNEQYGTLPNDAAVRRHLDGPEGWEGSIYNVTRQVLERARAEGTTSFAAANRLGDELAAEAHPIWGDRARRIIQSLVDDHWETQRR